MAPIDAFNLYLKIRPSLSGPRTVFLGTHLGDGRDIAGAKCSSSCREEGQTNAEREQPGAPRQDRRRHKSP